MGRLCRLCVILQLLLASIVFGQTTAPSSTQPNKGRAAVMVIEGEINDFTADQLARRIEKAKSAGVDTIILQLDTPGGSVGSALAMSRLLKRTGEALRTIAYVDPMAYSAGTMLSIACHEVAMSPGAMMGDCAPIIVGASGLSQVTGAERAKMESPIVADFEDSAERNGYDPLMVRSFVQYQLTIHYVENAAGERRYVTPEAYTDMTKDGRWWAVPGVKNPLDDGTTLLTVNNTTAERIGLSRGTYATVEELAAARGLTIVERFETTPTEAVLGLLNGAAVRGLLATIFLMTLYAAFSHPGTGFAEVAALVIGSVLIGVPLLTGYAGWVELLLIFIGIALLAVELFILPGFGIAGISGIVLLMAGLVMTFVPSEAPGLPDGPSFLPQLQQTQDALKEGLIVTIVGMGLSVGLWIWLSRYLPAIPYLNKLILSTDVGSTPLAGDDFARDAALAAWPAVGTKGVVTTDLRPGGTARFFDTLVNDDRPIDVISDRGFIPAGRPVIVRRRDGSEIYVRETAEEVSA